MCVSFAGKPFSYMPYEVKLSMEQDAHGGVVRPGTPYRLSPREPSRASPQPDSARYSVPPGKQGTYTHQLDLPPTTSLWCGIVLALHILYAMKQV